jgi:YHS domain-containing protein
MNILKHFFIFSLIGSIFFAGLLTAGNSQDTFNVNENGIVLDGYDVVAYFTQYKAIKGSVKFEATYQNVNFWFANDENKEKFLENPEKFLPQYGGYCAFAVGKKNAKVPSNPQTFKLYEGKLYLFFNSEYEGKPMNTIIPWNNHEEEMKKMADANWEKLKE